MCINEKTASSKISKKMPAIFIGHGSPMNAIEDNELSESWMEIGKRLPKQKAILCISAHWETSGSRVTAMENPKTIHDFYGFPSELYQQRYPAPGSPELAKVLQQIVEVTEVHLDFNWGLDHGAWSVLSRMFPLADVPVVQLSLDKNKSPKEHYQLGQELQVLRDRDILILGSGNMVHNLGLITWEDRAYQWAAEFDEVLKELILSKDHNSIINYPDLGKNAKLAIMTNEHFLPLLYILALQQDDDEVNFFAERVTFGSISMRSITLF